MTIVVKGVVSATIKFPGSTNRWLIRPVNGATTLVNVKFNFAVAMLANEVSSVAFACSSVAWYLSRSCSLIEPGVFSRLFARALSAFASLRIASLTWYCPTALS